MALWLPGGEERSQGGRVSLRSTGVCCPHGFLLIFSTMFLALKQDVEFNCLYWELVRLPSFGYFFVR